MPRAIAARASDPGGQLTPVLARLASILCRRDRLCREGRATCFVQDPTSHLALSEVDDIGTAADAKDA